MASTVSKDHQVKSKTILVVDDEAATRGLISLILRQGGYAVLEARDCETAATIHQRHQGQIDLLLTDISLPGPDGVELAAALRRSEPELPVLFMSGNAETDECEPFLRKPFGVAELLRQVRMSVERNESWQNRL